MPRYHITPKGDAGLCRAELRCPYGEDTDHFDSPDAARAAYEAGQSSLPPLWAGWKRGKKMSKADLEALPTGATVRWAVFKETGRVALDLSKQETGTWMESSGLSSRQYTSSIVSGAQGNPTATYVSGEGLLTEELPEIEAPAPRVKPEAKWAIIRVSNVTGRVFIDHEFSRLSSGEKKLSELNRYDHLHHSYELVPMSEAKSRASG